MLLVVVITLGSLLQFAHCDAFLFNFSSLVDELQLPTDLLATAVLQAHCRAQCIEVFSDSLSALTDADCESDQECAVCWDSCSLFAEGFEIWGSMCQHKELCFEGCRTACRSYDEDQYNDQGNTMIQVNSFSSSVRLYRSAQLGRLSVFWQYPLQYSSKHDAVVYTIFWRPTNGSWQPYEHQTIDISLQSRDASLVTELSELLLIAVGRNGPMSFAQYPAPISIQPTRNVVSAMESNQSMISNNQITHALYFNETYSTKVGEYSLAMVATIAVISGAVSAIGFFGCIGLLLWILSKRRHRRELYRSYAVRIKSSHLCHPEKSRCSTLERERKAASDLYGTIDMGSTHMV